MTAPKLTVHQKAVESVKAVEQTLQCGCIFVTFIIVSAILFVGDVFLNFLAADPALAKGLFKHGIANVSFTYPLNITPSGWAFSIWGVIYLFQLMWVIYSVGLTCRQTDSGPAYLHPVVLSPAFFIFFSLSSFFNIGWIFLWDRLLFLASFIFLACIVLSLWLTLAIASSRVFMFSSNLIDQGRQGEVKFLQMVLINGVAMYATWSTFASFMNLAVVFVYKWDTPIPNENACVICLGILAFLTVVYIGLDVTVFERYNRFCISPYAVIIWTLSGILTNNYNPDNVSSILAVCLLGAVAVALLMKLGISFYHCRKGQYQYRPMQPGRRPLGIGKKK